MTNEFVEIELEVSKELMALLKAEAIRSARTIDEIINEAIRQSLEKTPVDPLVLDPKGKGGSHAILCSPGMRNYDRFNISTEIQRHSDASEIDIHFGSGKVLRITPKTTWKEVHAYLDSVF